jgi:TP901 family phage tail tape measure protein
MPLSTREVFLILRARDEASRVIKDFSRNVKKLDDETMKAAQAQISKGSALSTIGVGLAAAGTAATAFFKSSIDASIEYTRQAALTETQTDKVKVSIEQLKDIGRELASTMPVDFDQVQAALYDIFSSIDASLPEAKKLMHEFAMESVAGQEDLQKAGKGTISILNSFKVPIKDVRTISDTMFQLVRKGVGTYAQFNAVIGRAVPSAVRAGQSFQDLAGMMAFLTRNGLSAAMASASAGRALDAFSNQKVVGRLEKMGIAVKNAKGEFLPISQVVTQLGKKLQNLSGPDRASALNDLFKGAGGTIQARRFYDIAVKNYKQLNQYTSQMKNSRGAMQQAYNTMFKQPQSQAVLLSNNIKILKTLVGDALVPAWMKLTGIMIKVVKWFNNLSPHTRTLIVRIAALSATLAIVIGGVLAVAGAILMFTGALAIAGTTLGAVLLPIALVIAALIAIGVAIYFVIKYHKQIWTFMKKVWGDAVQLFNNVKQAVMDKLAGPISSIIAWVQKAGMAVAKFAEMAGKYIAEKFGGPVREIGGWFADAGGYIAKWAKQIYKDLSDTVGKVIPIIVNGAKGAWGGIAPVLSAIWNALVKGAKLFWKGVKPALDAFAKAWPTIRDLLDKSLDVIIKNFMFVAKIIRFVGEVAGKFALGALTLLIKVIKFLAPIIGRMLVDALYILVAAFKIVGSIVAKIIPPIFQMIGRVIGNIINILHGLILFVLGVFTGNWSKAWEGIKMIFSNIILAIWNIIKGVGKTIVGAFMGLVQGIVKAAKWLWDKLVGHSIFPDIANGIIYWFNFILGLGPKIFKKLLDGIVSLAKKIFDTVINIAKEMPKPFVKAGTWLFQQGKNFVQGLLNGIWNIAGTIHNWLFDHVINPAIGAFKAAGTWLFQHGKNFVQGLYNGVLSLTTDIRNFLFVHIINPAVGVFNKAGTWLVQNGKNFVAGFWNGMKEFWHNITDWIGGIAKWIKDHKGPVWLDGQLLVPAGKAIMSGFLNGLKTGATDVYKFITGLGSKVGGAVNKVVPTVPNATGMAKIVQSVADQMFGWGHGSEWNSLYELVMHESGFRSNAQNPTSTAYGLFQFLNSTWGSVGATKTSDPTQQTIAGLKYIKQSYGSPNQAWAAWQSRSPHWYGDGGSINEPIMGLGMRSGNAYGFGERGKEWIFNEQQMAALANSNKGGVTVPITINTQEIDPRKHAADLGWEIGRRVK